MKTSRLVQAISSACVLAVMAVTVSAEVSDKLKSRVDESATVLTEIHAAPDKDVPKELWDRATCVIVIPSLKKAAFVFGGEYGKGMMSCRRDAGWSAPRLNAGIHGRAPPRELNGGSVVVSFSTARTPGAT